MLDRLAPALPLQTFTITFIIFRYICTRPLADVPYEMTVYTSDLMGAGTSANVYIVLYGSDGATEELMLADTSKKKKDSFKRGSTDQFVKEVS